MKSSEVRRIDLAGKQSFYNPVWRRIAVIKKCRLQRSVPIWSYSGDAPFNYTLSILLFKTVTIIIPPNINPSFALALIIFN
jgi:hypothetical protein